MRTRDLKIRELRETYPKAVILLTTTLLCHDESWDRAIEEVCRRIHDDRIRHYLYRRNGCGTPGKHRIQVEIVEEGDENAPPFYLLSFICA